ncbi:MAG: sugar ABC transporter permease [Oscillospiraceae bacterium]|nr:sugar ABC transporter permease [Oscillospiraceae bacterium]
MQENQVYKKRRTASLFSGFKRYLPNYLGLAPFFFLYIIFILIPMLYGVTMSFTNWSTRSRDALNFVGFDNYVYMLSGTGSVSRRFLKSLSNMIIYVPITCIIGICLALGLALIVNQFHKRAFKFYRGAFFIPRVLPLFLCTGIWQWYISESGLVNSALASIGLGEGIAWANTPGYAIAFILIIDIWHAVGFHFIILSTGMQDISQEYFDASKIDGASTFQQMRLITIPLIEPLIFFCITFGIISAIQVYDIPWILTNNYDITDIGGPNNVLLFPVMEMVLGVYRGDASGLGRSASQGVILMSGIGLITAVRFKLRRKKV